MIQLIFMILFACLIVVLIPPLFIAVIATLVGYDVIFSIVGRMTSVLGWKGFLNKIDQNKVRVNFQKFDIILDFDPKKIIEDGDAGYALYAIFVVIFAIVFAILVGNWFYYGNISVITAKGFARVVAYIVVPLTTSYLAGALNFHRKFVLKKLEDRRKTFARVLRAQSSLLGQIFTLEDELDNAYAEWGLYRKRVYIERLEDYLVKEFFKGLKEQNLKQYLGALINEATQELTNFKRVQRVYVETQKKMEYVENLLKGYDYPDLEESLLTLKMVFYSPNFTRLISQNKLDDFLKYCSYVQKDLNEIESKLRIYEKYKAYFKNGSIPEERIIKAFETLGVKPDDSIAVIKEKYRKLVLKYHPDRVQDVDKKKSYEEKFKEITNAYEIVIKFKKEVNR